MARSLAPSPALARSLSLRGARTFARSRSRRHPNQPFTHSPTCYPHRSASRTRPRARGGGAVRLRATLLSLKYDARPHWARKSLKQAFLPPLPQLLLDRPAGMVVLTGVGGEEPRREEEELPVVKCTGRLKNARFSSTKFERLSR